MTTVRMRIDYVDDPELSTTPFYVMLPPLAVRRDPRSLEKPDLTESTSWTPPGRTTTCSSRPTSA